jgi:hypothetical protein
VKHPFHFLYRAEYVERMTVSKAYRVPGQSAQPAFLSRFPNQPRTCISFSRMGISPTRFDRASREGRNLDMG